MKMICALVALCFVAQASARPAVVFKESARLNLNVSVVDGYAVGGPIAVEGDDAIVMGFRAETDDIYQLSLYAAFLFHRSGTTWNLVRKLGEGTYSSVDDYNPSPAVAMKDGVAATTVTQPYLFERLPNGDWRAANIAPDTQGGDNPASDIDIDQGRVFIGWGSWGGTLFERDSAGSWHGRYLAGENSGNGDNGTGGPVTVSGAWAGVLEPYNFGGEVTAPAISMFNNNGPLLWTPTERLLPPEGHSFNEFALQGLNLFIVDTPRYGIARYALVDNSHWVPRAQLRTAADFMSGGGSLEKGDGFLAQQSYDYDRKSSVIRIFQAPATNGEYAHVATLIDSRGGNLSLSHVSGRRVVASTVGSRLIFDLPATFTGKQLRQDTFDSGSGNWTQLAGSQWSVAQSGITRVFRQASTVGDAGASFNGVNWASQSIQADITPTAFNGADRWVGLATRRIDAANYYYVTLRSSGIVALKRNKDGAFANLATASFPVALNRTYRVRLESFGTNHRVFIDDVLVLEAVDASLIAGHPALLTSRAAADFDNVLVSPYWTNTIHATDGNDIPGSLEGVPQPEPWTYSGTGQFAWARDGTNLLLRQSSTAGDARAAIDPANEQIVDPIVAARVRITSFGAGSGEKWAGLMAKYTDPQNFIYMSVRSSNVVTLRRVEAGRVRIIGTVAMPVSVNTWYSLRLETVGDRVRAYVGGKLVIEAIEAAPAGSGGIVTYQAAADFDDFKEIQP